VVKTFRRIGLIGRSAWAFCHGKRAIGPSRFGEAPVTLNWRISSGTLGLPPRDRDFRRQNKEHHSMLADNPFRVDGHQGVSAPGAILHNFSCLVTSRLSSIMRAKITCNRAQEFWTPIPPIAGQTRRTTPDFALLRWPDKVYDSGQFAYIYCCRSSPDPLSPCANRRISLLRWTTASAFTVHSNWTA
jgi:hypothetical protein